MLFPAIAAVHDWAADTIAFPLQLKPTLLSANKFAAKLS
jgi:hypothetical protein